MIVENKGNKTISLSNIAESLFELNESVKFLVEEIKKEKKNDT